ncbi:hypothetical protein Q5752_000140 [Cryptotrichosporon argae]
MMHDFGTSPTDSTTSHQSVEINDAVFCEHAKEVCDKCGFDGREDNDYAIIEDSHPRDPLDVPAFTRNVKDGKIVCKAHANKECKQCFNWKKQMTKLHKEGKKVTKAKQDEAAKSNF